VRTIFRLIEFALGIEGYPFSHEWCLYVFESTPMYIALTALAVCHPVRLLQEKRYYEEGLEIGVSREKGPTTAENSAGSDEA
jgi:hypothetical protein